ncbi:MAG: DUF3365 domain-containing protein [Nitrospirae bacterium]|nr:DUF3365 domain-containing protein [Nitrospirota bacterium]
MKKLVSAAMVGLFILASGPSGAAERAAKEKYEATLLAQVMTAARQVLAENQGLINEPNLGDKGFTADVFAQKTIERSKRLFSIDPSDAAMPPVVKLLWESMNEVVREAQHLINEKGKSYKGFLPVVFARQTSAKFTAKMPGAYAKLTSIREIIHNPVNDPDDWEEKILMRFRKEELPKGEPYSEITTFRGKRSLRLIQPEYFLPVCLTCHGDPKGSIEPISKTKLCGQKPGAGGSGFSIALPLE